ncbi:MAG: hypothetical protein A3C61_03325 [Candidatus Yanofskybacteria bacterium RIFCSPHIGHO2_02_FULL_39_10]|uniref:HD/PDEase domain-containing protein n=1 Tax=Candidatus Yanofskybacteria bacterium RIFCSPHIGHO2_02_FULL_39_10 TaxID=1802674 RepID=A0A1F8F456_9BACT|nr:MAG: hypothetical protein A3C61_03325 [Candidatus Yanofskybacteria bacterium RIFCSPHIGHO2_02_FULL_39_10]
MLPKIWELYPDLARAVKRAHGEVGLNNGGHDFDHALRVAQMAIVVAYEHDKQMVVFAGVAGLLHNNDRILERMLKLRSENVSSIPDIEVVALTARFLSENTGITVVESKPIIDAVINHGSKPNALGDHIITIALADADRLINMEPDVIIRAGQHHADIPALDPVYIEETPGANYRDPKTVIWDVANCITWASDAGPYILRLPLSRKLGQERAAYLREFVDTLRRQRKDLGLVPYPEI